VAPQGRIAQLNPGTKKRGDREVPARWVVLVGPCDQSSRVEAGIAGMKIGSWVTLSIWEA
jgi:hypothetical protein